MVSAAVAMHDLSKLDPEAVELLEQCGFVWDPVLDEWFNVHAHRAISFGTVRDHSLEWLCGWLEGATALTVNPKG